MPRLTSGPKYLPYTHEKANDKSDFVKCQVCGSLATHHHKGNHFCVEHARDYAKRAKWRKVLFWLTPSGAIIKDDLLEAI